MNNYKTEEGVLRTLHRLQNNVGHTEKNRRYTTNAARVLKYIWDSGGTIDFDKDSVEMKGIGLKTIFHKIAYDLALDDNGMPVAKPNLMLRCRSAEKHFRMAANAVKEVRDHHLFVDNHIPLLCVPRTEGQKGIAVITVYPDYVVNGVETAGQLGMKTKNRRMRSRIARDMEWYEAVTGSRGGIAALFRDIVDEVSQEHLGQAWFNLTPIAESHGD